MGRICKKRYFVPMISKVKWFLLLSVTILCFALSSCRGSKGGNCGCPNKNGMSGYH